MNDEVRMAVDTKLGVLRDYYEVPEQCQGEYEDFLAAVMAVGEECSAYMEFEEKYAAAGLDKRMQELMLKCALKPQDKMSAKDAAAAAKDAYKTTVDTEAGRKEWAKKGVSDAAEMASMAVADELFHKGLNTRTAFEDENPEFHEARNAVNQARTAAWHLFGKKKNK